MDNHEYGNFLYKNKLISPIGIRLSQLERG